MIKAIVFCFLLASSQALARTAEKPITVLYKSYLAMIKNSIGGRLWRNLYYQKKNGRAADLLQDGNLSCAYYVSSILLHFGLIREFQAEVGETVAAMQEAGWQKIDKPVSGSIIVWKNRYFEKSGTWHKHIGFFLGPGRAVSNSSERRSPAVHHLRYKGRKVESFFWHPRLAEGVINSTLRKEMR